MKTEADSKNGPEMVQTVAQTAGSPESRPAKTHQDFWKSRLVRRSYKDRDGRTVEMPEWHVRIADLGRRAWFNLDTANQVAAAAKARDIYVSLVSAGWAATLAKYKPDPIAKADLCNVGEFLADVRERSHLKPVTVRRYAVKLRKLIADIAKVDQGKKVKALHRKYDYHGGGRDAWLAKVDSQSVGILTPDSITAWRNIYVAKGGTDPLTRKGAERSAASIMRCARALFAPDVTAVLKVKLPAYPFAGVKMLDPGPMRYHSDIDPTWLLACAEREMNADKPKLGRQEYLALNLCLWGGLRRKEADLLRWQEVDFGAGQIHIRRTPHFEPKTESAQRDIDLSPVALDIIRSFKGASQSEFVLDGGDARPSASFDYYRADATWRSLSDWLGSKGVRERKKIHALRKESGALMASQFGIESAREHLGHSTIGVTSAIYVAKKSRREVSLTGVEAAGQLRAVEGNP